MNIQLPSDIKAVNPNPEGEGIQLPFSAPLFWWKNGDSRMSQLGGVQHFGGWESEEKDIVAASAENGELPDDFVYDSRVGKEGTYQVCARRNLTIVPIKTRRRWIERSHSQTLVLIGLKRDGGGFDVWGTAVLTAKGYSSARLTSSFDAWDKHTRDTRKEIAPGVPSFYFWQATGTFGDFKEETVGSKKKNAITPIQAYLPEMSAGLLQSLYVGDETARLMSELSDQAQEWATDKRWLKNEKDDVLPENNLLEGQSHLSHAVPAMDDSEFPFQQNNTQPNVV